MLINHPGLDKNGFLKRFSGQATPPSKGGENLATLNFLYPIIYKKKILRLTTMGMGDGFSKSQTDLLNTPGSFRIVL
jgi:hypothetical protein